MADEQLTSSLYGPYYTNLTLEQREGIDRSFACVAHQIAEFIRGLGKQNIWSSLARNPTVKVDDEIVRGAELFSGKGRCAICHYGEYFTDFQFHNIGIGDVGDEDASDPGRYSAVKAIPTNPYNILAKKYYPQNVTETSFRRSEEMWGAFKTPSLLGIASASSYMHNGKFHSLEEVVDYYDSLREAVIPPHHYAGLLAPLGLSDSEKHDLLAFLRSL
jgi:cytochrome c peroxidase